MLLSIFPPIHLSKFPRVTIRCLQVDDDVFVNPDQLWRTLESSHLYSVMVNMPATSSPVNIDYALIGHVMNTVPIRDPASKWYLPPTFYPLNIFPSFLSGTGYLLTGSLVPALYSCALSTPFINLEDVFLTGLCATTQLRSHPQFHTICETFLSAFGPYRPPNHCKKFCMIKYLGQSPDSLLSAKQTCRS